MKQSPKYSCTIFFSQIFLLHFENVTAYMVGNNPYHRKEMLDTNGKYQLEWQVNQKNKLNSHSGNPWSYRIWVKCKRENDWC